MAYYGSPGNPNLRDLPRAKQSPVDKFRVKGAANMIREQVKTAGNIMSDDIPEALGLPTKTILVHFRKGTLTLHDLLTIVDTYPEVSIDSALKMFAFESRAKRDEVREEEARLDAPGYAEKRLTAVANSGDDPEVAEILSQFGMQG